LDATIYSQVFPEAPLLGFYAGKRKGLYCTHTVGFYAGKRKRKGAAL
jgi:hypothetical protein